MPELPEMETYRRLLSERIEKQKIVAVEINREKSINVDAATFRRAVEGRVVTAVRRRAKQLQFVLDSGDVLLLHLMLGGTLYLAMEAERPERTIQVTISLSGGKQLYFIGLRLGYLHVYSHEETAEKLAKLGPEPLEPGFSVDTLHAAMSKRRGTLKAVLVDQTVLSGIGNCYSDEICFHARLLPTRRVPTLTNAEWTALYSAVRSTLSDALRYGGYMDTPLFPGDTLTGGYDNMLRVYDRPGEPCVRCGGAIAHDTVNGRKCFYCTQCQF